MDILKGFRELDAFTINSCINLYVLIARPAILDNSACRIMFLVAKKWGFIHWLGCALTELWFCIFSQFLLWLLLLLAQQRELAPGEVKYGLANNEPVLVPCIHSKEQLDGYSLFSIINVGLSCLYMYLTQYIMCMYLFIWFSIRS